MTDAEGFRLEGVGHAASLEFFAGQVVSVGRAHDCGLSLADATVSRRHAELRAGPGYVDVTDLASANGIRINGVPVGSGRLVPDDLVTFGSVAFRLVRTTVPATRVTPVPADDLPPGTVVRSLPGRRLGQADALARLLELAQRLSGAFDLDAVLADVTELAFDLLPVDRVSVLLVTEGEADPIPVAARSRFGDASGVRAPRAIVRRAMTDRTPVVTENPAQDADLRSASVVLQAVRRAICVPLMASGERVVGALYADSLTGGGPFSQEDADALLALAGLAAVSVSRIRLADEAQRAAAMQATFERFFAPEVAADIARRGPAAASGERCTVTILFTDIRDFTPLAERLAPDRVARLLTEYFTRMADIVFEHGGTLDKFIGDAILAVWGAPVRRPGDTDRALAAARAMQADIARLNARWEAAGDPPFHVGIGLSRGEVFAGTLGGERRMEYTVIGDAVNVASRLAGQAGAGEILLTDAVRVDTVPTPTVEPVADIALKGKAETVAIYRLAASVGTPNR